jgi:hypothetical protein
MSFVERLWLLKKPLSASLARLQVGPTCHPQLSPLNSLPLSLTSGPCSSASSFFLPAELATRAEVAPTAEVHAMEVEGVEEGWLAGVEELAGLEERRCS